MSANPARTRTIARVAHHALSLAGLVACVACSAPVPAESTKSSPTSAAAAGRVAVSDAMRQQMGITVSAAERESRTDQLTAPAVMTLDESRTSRLSARAEGTIAHVFKSVGDRVAANATLAELHSHTGHDLLALYRDALANQRQKARELQFAQDVEARTARLFADQAAARQDVERTEATRIAAQQQLAMADTEVERASHDLEFFGIEPTERSSMDVSMPVQTPIAGTVIERMVTVGTTVNIAAPLFVVSDLSRLWALAEVDEAKLSALAEGQTVDLSVAAYPGAPFKGRVTSVGATVDPTTRRVVVRIEVGNADGRLKPNMFASVLLSTGTARDGVVVPSSAIQQLARGPVVFVEEAEGVFKAASVVLGDERDGRVEILEGLSAGERVAVGGAFLLKSELQKASLSEEG